MRYKMLVVDDDFETVQSIKEAFDREEGVVIIVSDSATIGVEMAWKERPDIIIANSGLPGLTGWEMLGILKKNEPTRPIPFVMLNDKPDGVEDEIKVLEAGADDYINKPFDLGLFRARIKVVLRRWQNQKKEIEAKEILKSKNIILNMTTHAAYIKEKLLDLTPKEFALLYLFIKKKNRVLNRVFLSETIWEREYFNTSHTIDKHIANLREKLGSESERIETLPTVGYKFIEED